MKFYHVADLHFGKSIYGLSMLDDQQYWVNQFINYCKEDKPDAVVVAGDVYDRSNPSAEAVELLDDFLTRLSNMDIPVLMIAGNHDSGQKLSFAHQMLAKQNIHIAGTVKKEIKHVTLKDAYGNITFWLLPYTFPEQISTILENDELRTYDGAVKKLIDQQNIDFTQRNVMISHQNVVSNGKEIERGGSESMVGGVGQIDYTAFDGFDYVALGHIHSSYPVGRETVRYAGTPLCYHFKETRQAKKGFVEVIIKSKEEPVEINVKELKPLHKMRYLEGTKDEIYALLEKDNGRNEYLGITITNQRITPESMRYIKGMLESHDSLLLEMLSTYTSFSGIAASVDRESVENKSLEDLFSDLYQEQSDGTPPGDDEYAIMKYVGELVRNQDVHLPLDTKDIDKILKKAEALKGEYE